MNAYILLIALLAAGLDHTPTAAVPEADEIQWTLPEAEAEKWASRVRALLPARGWTVTASENDIVVRRDKSVRFAVIQANEDEGAERELREGPYRLTLRFGPRLSMDEYERLAAVNAASVQERDRLRRTLAGISHKFYQYRPTTPEEERRVREYEKAAGELPWHTLPELYTHDFSICVFSSDDDWSYVHDEEDAAECHDVRAALLKFFGMYDPAGARDRGARIGRPEPAP